jgi:hypothetical protein
VTAAEPEPDERTLPARLRAFYAEAPRTLSTPELAARFVPHVYAVKPAHAERQVQRANRLIRRTYGNRFVETVRRDGRSLLAPTRYIKPGGVGLYDSLSSDRVEIDLRDLELQADADRARAREPAFRSTPRAPRTSERAREVRGSEPRRRAVPHGVRNPRLLEAAPVQLEGLAAMRARHAGWADVLTGELRRQRYHDHPLEACRAVRTLAERESTEPLRLFRHLFNRAVDGDMLIDLKPELEADDAAEQSARVNYKWDPDDPSTHWRGADDDKPPEPTAAELEARRWAAVRRAREVELRKPAGVGWWHILASIAKTARFLGSLKPETVATVAPGK